MVRTTPISVLLVEDEVLISHLVAEWLSEFGCRVHEAGNADEALHYLEQGGPVDVLFTDINLGAGMDGTELARRVRERRPDMPVVYASGRSQVVDCGGLVPRSVFLAKPYDRADLSRLVEALRSRAGQAAPRRHGESERQLSPVIASPGDDRSPSWRARATSVSRHGERERKRARSNPESGGATG